MENQGEKGRERRKQRVARVAIKLVSWLYL
jgi:hypothetical protein